MSDATTSAYRIQHLSGEENYQTWSVKVTDILTDLGLIDYPMGRIPKPSAPDNDSTVVEWYRKDRQALSAIRLRVADGPLIYITTSPTSKDAWDILARTYQPKGAIAIVLLRRKLMRALCQEGGEIEEHIRNLTNIRQRLASLGSPLTEPEFCITLLTSLPDSWNSFIQGVDTTSLDDSSRLVARILEQERQRTAKPNSDEVALAAKFSHKQSKYNSSVTCYGCGRKGHIIADCRDTKAGKTYTKEQKERNRQSRNPPRQSGQAHVTEATDRDTTSDFAFMATSSAPRDLPSDTWLADCAATRHIVKSQSIFSTYSETPGHIVKGFGQSPSLGTGTALVASHIGNSAYSISLTDSLHVPSAPYNLISIGRMTSAGCSVKFQGEIMKVFSPGSSPREIMHGTRVGNLYKVHITHSPTRTPSPSTKSADSPNIAFPSESSHGYTWDKWHRIFGHLQNKSVQMLKEKGMVTGMVISDPNPPSPHCETCVQAKSHVMPFPPQSDTIYKEIGGMTFTDVWGPSRITGIDGSRYYVSFTDGATRRSVVYFMKVKSEVEQKIRQYTEYILTQTGKRIKCFRCDNGREYVNAKVKEYLANNGIRLELTAAYSPQQNGVAERLNRTLIEHARAMLAAHNLPLFLWPEAVAYATFLKNRSPTRALVDPITPDEAFWGKKPDVSTLQEFGSPCWVLRQDGKQGKLNLKTRPFIFTGLTDESRAWRYYNPDARTIQTSRNITFAADTPAESSEFPVPPTLQLEGEKDPDSETPTPEPSDPLPHPSTAPAPASSASTPSTLTPFPSPKSTHTPTPRKAPRDISSTITEDNIILGPRTRKYTKPDTAVLGYALAAVSDPIADDPLTVAEAKSRTDWPHWQKAMDEEMAQLHRLGTFSLEPLPTARSAVACKWVFRIKRDDSGNISRYKARLVAKGFSQIPGVDFDETFAPVVRIETIRLLLALAAHYSLKIHVVDVIGAYLNGKLNEEIYMQQPQLYEDGTTRVCRLHRTLYGLKQSGRIWNLQLNSSFLKLGFTRLLSDQCVYIRRQNSDITIVAVHVDDMTVLTSSDALMEQVESELNSEFSIKKLGEIRQLLGMEITRTEESIHLTQVQYITKILEKYQMGKCNPVATPIDPNVTLAKLPDGKSFPEIQHVYQHMVGSLLYAAITTRPDISNAVLILSQFNTNPGPEHLTAAKRVFRYLQGTIDLGVEYNSEPITALEMYSDSNWGTDPDTRRSITGYVSMYAGGAITWNSKKQPTVALSSMEAEYMALSSATREALWLRTMFSELGLDISIPTHINVDNQGTILFAENSGYHARSKHIDIRYHFIRENIASNKVSVSYIPTDENTADIFTKGLTRGKHEYITSLLGMIRA